jgi:hypothetical protein
MLHWAKAAVDEWMSVVRFSEGLILGGVNKGDRITRE